jgi:hypothetical protein
VHVLETAAEEMNSSEPGVFENPNATRAMAFVKLPPQKQNHERRELERVRHERDDDPIGWVGNDRFGADGSLRLRQEIADKSEVETRNRGCRWR